MVSVGSPAITISHQRAPMRQRNIRRTSRRTPGRPSTAQVTRKVVGRRARKTSIAAAMRSVSSPGSAASSRRG